MYFVGNRPRRKRRWGQSHLFVSKYWSRLFWICSRFPSMAVTLETMLGSEQQDRIAFGLLNMSAISLLKSAFTCETKTTRDRERKHDWRFSPMMYSVGCRIGVFDIHRNVEISIHRNIELVFPSVPCRCIPRVLRRISRLC